MTRKEVMYERRYLHKMLLVLRYLATALVITLSASAQKRVANSYWSKSGVPTHGNSDETQFDVYFTGIRRLISKSKSKSKSKSSKLLDFGGGYGEIAEKFSRHGFEVDVAEFSNNFFEKIAEKGLGFIDAKNLPEEKYDIVVANNCFFYNHPSNQETEINRLLTSLRPGGSLLITDVPTVERINVLYPHGIFRVISHLTHVYQPEMGGFFIDGKKIARRFQGTIFDSWAPYRQHIIINKPIDTLTD